MSRNGLGTYSRVPGSAYTNGTVNDGSELDAEMNDIATALTDSLTADGQKTWAANQNAGTYKVTGLGAGSASTDSANLGQVQGQAYTWLTSVAGTDTITASASPAVTAYAAGQTFRFVPANTNTGAVTININSTGAKAITRNGTTALAAGNLATSTVYQITYDGTQFQLTGIYSAATTTASGIVELATNAEAQAGTDAVRAVTPAALASVTSTTTRAGLIETATDAEAQALSIGTTAITPATLGMALKGSNQSLTSNGYQIFPGGLILQWGSATAVGSSGTITFPIPFPNACFSVTSIQHSSSATQYGAIATPGLSSVVFYGGSSNISIFWMAVGY